MRAFLVDHWTPTEVAPSSSSFGSFQEGESGALSPELVRSSLDGIFDDRAYFDVLDSDVDAADKVAGFIKRITDFFDSLFRADGESSVVYWLLLVTLSILLIAFLVWSFLALRRESHGKTKDELGTSLAPSRQLEELLRKAMDSAIHEGSWTEALSMHFRLGLLIMVRRHPGRLRPGFTNRECLVAWADVPDYQLRLSAVIDLLDRKWYAGEECSREEFEQADSVLGEMRAYA